jgi:hypothetical protein
MLPASGMETKSKSLPPRPRGFRKHDTDGIDAITRHNDGSMGKFSYSG